MIKYRTPFRFITAAALLFLLVSCASNNKPTRAEIEMDMATNAYQMGAVHFNDGRYLEALKSLSRAVDIAPKEAKFHNALALAYGARGLYDRAKEHFKESILLDPMMSEAHLNLSALYLKEESWDKARESANGALKNVFYKTPEFAYYNIGWAMFNKGDIQGAVISFTKSVEVNPRYLRAHNDLGFVLERAGRDDDAEQAYLNALRLDDSFADARLNLGALLMRKGDKNGALREFNKIIEVAPGSGWAVSAARYIEELKVSP